MLFSGARGIISARRFMLLALFAAMPALYVCQPNRESRKSMPTRDIKTVMEAHVGDLMAMPGVAGVAIGELDNGTPCIIVMVVDLTDDLKRTIPKDLEGHPVIIEVSGEFKPM
ncbi:MAG: hypothetical protein HY770_09105 [Chitinivibrionia bacterium]|nr:hypothetical protein [Chitinivibrionia bacterium]